MTVASQSDICLKFAILPKMCEKKEITITIKQDIGLAHFEGPANLVRIQPDGSLWVRIPNSSIEIKVEEGNFTPDISEIRRRLSSHQDSG